MKHKEYFKQFLSLLLCVVMCMQAMPIISWAADEDDVVITQELHITDDPNFEAIKKQWTAEMNSVDMSEVFANLPNSENDVELMSIEESTFVDPGMELSHEDVITLCNMGYSVKDIEYAINLSKTYGLTPYTLLEMKGITTYTMGDYHTRLSGYVEGLSPIENTYKVSGKAWQDVINELNVEETAVVMQADALNTDIEDFTSVYNSYVLPKARYNMITPNLNLNDDSVSVDEKTGNITVTATDLTLKGKNGMDFSLRRIYNSTKASAYETIVWKTDDTYVLGSEYYAVGFVATLTINFINGSSDSATYLFLYAPDTGDSQRKIVLCTQVHPDEWKNSESLFHSIPKEYLYEDETDAETKMDDIIAGKYDSWIEEEFENLSAEIESYGNVSEASFYINPTTIDYKLNEYYYIEGEAGTEYWTYATDIIESPIYLHSDIGNGWEFDIPYIEIRDWDESAEYYLHFGTKGVYRYDEDIFSGLENYSYEDLELVKKSDESWVLSCGDGTKYNFSANGWLRSQTDKYDNVISYYYESAGGFRRRLTKVIDSVGRVIELKYSDATETDDAKVQITVREGENSNTVLHTITYYKEIEETGIEYEDEYGETKSFMENVVTLDRVIYEEGEAEEQSTQYTYLLDAYPENPFNLYYYNDLARTTWLNYAVLTNIENDTEQLKTRGLYGTSIDYMYQQKAYGVDGIRQYPCVSSVGNDDQYKQYTFANINNSDLIIQPDNSSLFSWTRIDNWSIGGCVYEDCEEQDVCDNYEHDRCYYEESSYVLFRPVKCTWEYATTDASVEVSSRLNYGYKARYEPIDDSTDREIIVENVYKNVTSYEYDRENIPLPMTYMEYGEYLLDNNSDELPYVRETGEYKKMYSEEYTWGDARQLTSKTIAVEGEDRQTKYTYAYTKDILTSYQVNDLEISGVELSVANTLTSDNNNIAESVVAENDVDKKRSTYTYDENNNMASETQYVKNGSEWVEARTIKYEYDTDKNINLVKTFVDDVTDVNGVATESGNESGVISVSYEYDDYGNIVKETDSNGNIYIYTYDKLGRITSAKTPNLGEDEYAFAVDYVINEDDYTYSVVQTDVNGWETEQVYDHYGRLIEIKDLDKGVTLNKYTYPMKAKSYVNTVSTEVKYNLNGDSATVLNKNAMGGRRVEQYVIDYDGSIIGKVVTNVSTEVLDDVSYSVVTTIVSGEDGASDNIMVEYYNAIGQLKRKELKHENSEGQQDDYVEIYEYDVFGNLIKTTRDRKDLGTDGKSVIAAEYNFSGQVLSAVDALGNETSYVYNELGEMTQMTDANNSTSYYEYDKLGRLIRERHPFDTVNSEIVYSEISYVYDGNGNVIETNMSSGEVGENEVRKVTTEYNWNNKPLTVTQYNGEDRQITQYYYDNKSQMVRMYTGLSSPLEINGLDNVAGSDSEYSVFGYEYDNYGNVIETTDALGKSESFIYDLNNTLIQKTDRNGTITEYSYDGMGRLLQKNAADGSELHTYKYFMSGNLKEASVNGITTVYEYDDLGRMISESENVGHSTIQKLYDYNSNGNVTLLQLKQGDNIAMDLNYEYDGNGWLKNVYDDDLLVAEYEYYDNGALKSVMNGATNTSYEYNVGNLLTTISNTIGDNIASEYSYTYYIDGNQKSKTDVVNNTTTSYVYNVLGYLTEESTPSGIVTYTYDDAGNRVLKNDVNNESVTSYAYDKNNRLKKQTTVGDEEIGTFRYTYDDAGNLVMKTAEYYKSDNGGAEGYSVENPGQYVEKYSYNAFGQMTKAVNGNNIAEYTYGADGLRRSKTVNGVVTNHIWSGGSIIAETGAEGIVTDKYIRGLGLLYSENESGDKKNYLYNGHGDVVQLVQGSEIVKNYDYTAFGEELQINPDDDNPFRYCGEYLDSETGFIYLRARYYDPSIGRFTQEDPIKDGLNWYNYCNNNPVMFVDSNGLQPLITDLIKYKMEHSPAVVLFYLLTQIGVLDAGYEVVGFTRDDDGVFHAKKDAWQKHFGFNDVYDVAFYVATDMERKKFVFATDETEFVIWLWKGDYLNLGAGGEVGIYYDEHDGNIGEFHWKCGTQYEMPMQIRVFKGIDKIVDYSDTTWWATGFNPKYHDVSADSLMVIAELDFSGQKDLWDAFYDYFNTDEHPEYADILSFDTDNYTVKVTW